jgi:anti-sigma factor RsiW
MKEQLESNLITKYAAGLMSNEEMKHLEEWLKRNPQYNVTVAIIKQRVDAMFNAGGRLAI